MTEQSGAADHERKREKRKQTSEEIVRRLQARIVKAQQEGKYNKVSSLAVPAHTLSERPHSGG